jgi:NADPH:quinone reductase-like Zn-dependent oxidoreductase/nucleoside-diphosphate-sugar epimerase
MTSPPRHVIFGTGAIGLATLDALLRRGESVRMVNRSGSARVPDDVEVVGGNAADPQFTVEVTRGAQVMYQTMNPPYERWVEEFPALQAGVLAAAETHGARLVSMENVYMYGRPAGRPLTESRDYAAQTKKGKLRGQMATELLDAHRAGRVSVAIGRASDYFGPGGGAQSNLGDRLFPAALSGKTATVLGDPDQPHSYTYIPDIGEGLAVLGEHPDAAGEVWHLPNDPNTHTTRQLVDLVFQQAGQPRTRLRQIKPWMVRIAALTNPTLRELPEMQYQFEEPFIVDSSKITNTLGVHATPVEQALADTLATYRTAASGTHPKSSQHVAVGTMMAIVHTDYGTAPEDVLRLEEVNKPAMADDQVLVRVRAASVDRGTWHIMAGLPYPIRVAGFGLRKPKYLNPGRSLAGAVEAVGNEVIGFDPGEEVFGIGEGSFAEYVCVRTDKLAPNPANLSFDEAAAVPISGLAALQAVRDHGGVKAGQTVLIVGASGGVGSFGVQIAKAYGAVVTGVCSTAKVDLVRALGADHVIDYNREDFADGQHRYDVILDIGGNRRLSHLRRALTREGRLVIVGGETDGRWLGGTDR